MEHDPLCPLKNPCGYCEFCYRIKLSREKAIRECIAAVEGTFKSSPTLGQQKAVASLKVLLEGEQA